MMVLSEIGDLGNIVVQGLGEVVCFLVHTSGISKQNNMTNFGEAIQNVKI